MSSKAKLSRGEYVVVTSFCLLFYVLFGVMASLIIEWVGGPNFVPDGGNATDMVAYLTFWPIFLVKYLGIGIWHVLVAFWHLVTL